MYKFLLVRIFLRPKFLHAKISQKITFKHWHLVRILNWKVQKFQIWHFTSAAQSPIASCLFIYYLNFMFDSNITNIHWVVWNRRCQHFCYSIVASRFSSKFRPVFYWPDFKVPYFENKTSFFESSKTSFHHVENTFFWAQLVSAPWDTFEEKYFL